MSFVGYQEGSWEYMYVEPSQLNGAEKKVKSSINNQKQKTKRAIQNIQANPPWIVLLYIWTVAGLYCLSLQHFYIPFASERTQEGLTWAYC